MDDSRRTFVKATLMAGGSAVLGSAMLGCGDDAASVDSGSADTGTADTGTADTGTSDTGTSDTSVADVGTDAGPSCAGEIGENHPQQHMIEVTPEDVAAGAEKSYDIQGFSDHTHTVIVTAANFTSLAGGETVSIDSDLVNGHPHTVMLSCSNL